jgi:hypothetical protein
MTTAHKLIETKFKAIKLINTYEKLLKDTGLVDEEILDEIFLCSDVNNQLNNELQTLIGCS